MYVELHAIGNQVVVLNLELLDRIDHIASYIPICSSADLFDSHP